MKLFFFKFCLTFIILTNSSCSSDNNDSSATPTTTPETIIAIVSQGTWRITNYIDSDNNETNHFTGYNFTFGANSVLTASNGTNTYTGTWSVTTSNSNDDSSSNDLDFNIFFSSPADFVDLTDDWDITSKTDTKIQLIDVSGGNGGTDYLTFEKN